MNSKSFLIKFIVSIFFEWHLIFLKVYKNAKMIYLDKFYIQMKSFGEYVLREPYIIESEKSQLIEGQNKNTGVRMAIKYFPPSIRNKFEPAAVSRSFVDHVKLRHKNIIHYHETVQNAEGIFLVMNWCNLKSLRDIRQEYIFQEKVMARYVLDILRGLSYLHQQGIWHKNVKASNVLLTENEALLTDFGFSAMVTQMNIADKPYWSAPEVLSSNLYSRESDIWSLGCTIIELITGKPPWGDLPPDEARTHILTETPPIPSQTSPHLCDFLRFCFSKDPSKRPTAENLMESFWITTNCVIPEKMVSEKKMSHASLKIELKPRQVNFSALEKIFDDEDEEEDEDDDNFEDLPKFSQTSHVDLIRPQTPRRHVGKDSQELTDMKKRLLEMQKLQNAKITRTPEGIQRIQFLTPINPNANKTNNTSNLITTPVKTQNTIPNTTQSTIPNTAQNIPQNPTPKKTKHGKKKKGRKSGKDGLIDGQADINAKKKRKTVKKKSINKYETVRPTHSRPVFSDSDSDDFNNTKDEQLFFPKSNAPLHLPQKLPQKPPTEVQPLFQAPVKPLLILPSATPPNNKTENDDDQKNEAKDDPNDEPSNSGLSFAPNKPNPMPKLPSSDGDSDDIDFDLPKMNNNQDNKHTLQLPGLLTLPREKKDSVQPEESDMSKMSPVQNQPEPSKNPAPLLTLPNNPAPLLTLPNQPQNQLAPLLTLPVNSQPNPMPDFSSDDSDAMDFDLPKSNNSGNNILQLPDSSNLPNRQITPNNSSGSLLNKTAGQISKGESIVSLNNFIESSSDNSDDAFDVDSDDAEPLTLKIPMTVKEVADLSDIEIVTEEEARIFAKKDRLDSLTREIVSVFKSVTIETNEETLLIAFQKVSDIIKEDPDVRSFLVSQQCVLPIIEILAFSSLSEKLEVEMLKIILEMCRDQKDIQENFCLLGGIPPILEHLALSYSYDIRAYSLAIIYEICKNSFDNAQLLIACNGVSGLVEVLGYDTKTEVNNIMTAVTIIYDIFKVLKASQKVDFSRIFMQGNAFVPLQKVLFDVAEPESELTDKICELDHTFAQADAKVRNALGSTDVMKYIIRTIYNDNKVCNRLSYENLLLLLKCIKMVAADPENRDNLNLVGVMGMTCSLLKVHMTQDDTKELHLHANLIMLLADMCALSNERYYFVAKSRLLPHMKQYLQNESELKLTALSVIMLLYVAVEYDPKIVDTLIEDGLIILYLNSLSTPYWCIKAISAVQQLFERNIPKIKEIVCSDEAVQKIRDGILKVNNENAPTLLQKITSMLRASKDLTSQLIQGDFVQVVIAKFKDSENSRNQIQVSAALLDMINVIFHSNVENISLIKKEEIKNIVQPFTNAGNIKNMILAKQIMEFFQ
ncbi:hypothetical protein TRFO_15146 [Tritrichomonas foetus]|uniref:Protein kinase domain-containing protein n=1 Tax=Tritrichomonas foetus TaxID=1144522 RepID=A0A1J4KXQ7_9EUKA|nr:hypothetical protein TRFO_15146 [Tritrichomonas foetus]|eukprot:OHT14486.1 hypothetical protein TRFO_15146 [Tritrichomonas foetus]